MGFDRVLLALDQTGVSFPLWGLDAFVLPVGDHMRDAAYEVVQSLREEGISADVDLVGRGPSNLDFPSAVGARVAVLVGERAWEAGREAVEDLRSGDQVEVLLEELGGFLGAA